ncbi:MAG TPA: signal peptidase I [Planctomicrobium sp.]|nr:signal peptidase I [Planctomicrobium sp.]
MSQPEPSPVTETSTKAPAPVKAQTPKAEAPPKHKEGTRDTIESILFAFVLAFLFRTFEAEAFVIPTGSMAPTLYGRHKETICEACGHHVVVGASHEVVPDTGYLMANSRLRAAVCSNCGFLNEQIFKDPAFNGDRILVNKFTYEFGEPDRWDVFVFKYPTEPQTNYIKRLVGLPGETLRIRNGNLFQVDEDQNEIILRKPEHKQRVLQIPVYDDNEPPTELIKAGWPERWENMVSSEMGELGRWSGTDTGWERNEEQRTYSISKDQASPSWLRYRHFFPTPQDWRTFEHGLPLAPQPRLIGDFCGYNAAVGDRPFDAQSPDSIDFGSYWVPDLTINFDIAIKEVADQAELVLELSEGTTFYRCRIDLKTGQATLQEINTLFNNRVRDLSQAATPVKGPGSFRISFANVDDRLGLWVNDQWIDFGKGALLESPGATGNSLPTDQDLTPVGIKVTGATATISNLFLERDIYYRVGRPGQDFRHLSNQLGRFMNNPEMWGEVFMKHSRELGERTLVIPEDNFLAFGDNSPQSNDSRMWNQGQESVPRKFLVGKAFWIYWPHGVPFLNNGKGFPVTYHYQHSQNRNLEKVNDYPRYSLPFYPQFSRMTRIR